VAKGTGKNIEATLSRTARVHKGDKGNRKLDITGEKNEKQ